MSPTKMWIDNAWVDASDGGTRAVINPVLSDFDADCAPYNGVRPNSKRYVVFDPFGMTVPRTVAPWWPTPVAAPVVTVGGGEGRGGEPGVVNVRSSPTVVPEAFVAITR